MKTEPELDVVDPLAAPRTVPVSWLSATAKTMAIGLVSTRSAVAAI